MAMHPQEKIARQRLSVLQLAEALGNGSAVCRQGTAHHAASPPR